jgi:hypothetical protein
LNVVLVPDATVRPLTGTEPARDDVVARLALWLADVAADAALAPLRPLQRADDPTIPEPSPE